MIFINCPFLTNLKCIPNDDKPICVAKLVNFVSTLSSIPRSNLSVHNGCRKLASEELVENEASIFITLSLPGGKGGFGSMLRAIGAQIEKTTNREACRDLSGRRLRDINEEQRLKKWLAKKAEREQEKERRRKERLERMKQQPKHDFNDPEYSKQRSELPERIDDALSTGLKKAKTSLSKKRSRIGRPESSSKKPRIWSDSDDSNSANSDEELKCALPEIDPSIERSSSDNYLGVSSQEGDTTSTEDTKDKSFVQESTASEPSSSKDDISPVEVQTNSEKNVNSDIQEAGDPRVAEPLDLMVFTSVADLEALGLDKLKSVLMNLGLKCGGTIAERAQRLWSVRGMDVTDFPPALKAKAKKNTK